jgi:hypothetical protein
VSVVVFDELDEIDRIALLDMFPAWDEPINIEQYHDVARGNVVGRGKIEHGEDLPGSWHQQSNGGVRAWTIAEGEISA